MLNMLWPVFIIVSVFFSIILGNVKELNSSIFQSTADAVNLSITLLGTMCLWNGIMQIASKTSMIEKITRILKPIMKILFPNIKKNSDVYNTISMNMIANILGLGNAATPLGIKAMELMQKENADKKVLNNDMATFIVLNTASIQIIPTTVIAIRTSVGSQNPTSIIFPVWIATVCAAIAGMCAVKLFIKLNK